MGGAVDTPGMPGAPPRDGRSISQGLLMLEAALAAVVEPRVASKSQAVSPPRSLEKPRSEMRSEPRVSSVVLAAVALLLAALLLLVAAPPSKPPMGGSPLCCGVGPPRLVSFIMLS